MIYKDNLVTAWADTRKDCQVVRSDRYGSIKKIMGEWITASAQVKDAALQLGYWIEPRLTGWAILFDWPKDPDNPPNKNALHKDRVSPA